MNKKRFLGILFTLAMVLGLMVGMSSTAYADDPSYNLWVGGEEVKQSKTSGDGWSFNANTYTLTLNGANISTGDGGVGIYYFGTDNLNIVLSGTNTVKNDTAALDSGIFSANADVDIAFSGKGTLTVSGSLYGISSGNNITVNSGTVTATGESRGGILASKDVIIEGGTVNASGNFGIKSDGGNITINGGTVTAKGGEKGISAKSVKNAIAGTGWTNTAGTEGKADIAVSDGQDLSAYKKV